MALIRKNTEQLPDHSITADNIEGFICLKQRPKASIKLIVE